jgi:hypothetical protein
LGIRGWPRLRAWLNPPRVAQLPPPPKPVVPAPPPAKPRPPEPAPRKVIEAPPTPPVVAPQAPAPPKRVVLEADEQRARQLLAAGRKELHEMNFAAARKLFAEAARLEAADETRDEAARQARQAEQFEVATAHVRVSDFAVADTSWRLRFREGGQMRGLLLREDPNEIEFLRISDENPAAPGTQRATLPREVIAERIPVSRTERQEEFRGLLRRLEAAQGPPASAADYYDLVFLSKRLGLAEECLRNLERAYAKATDGALARVFRNVVISRALERASLLAGAGRRREADGVLRELTQQTLPGYAQALAAAAAFRADVLDKIRADYRSTLTLVKKSPAVAQSSNPAASARSARQLASAASAAEAGGGMDEEIVVDSSAVKGQGASATIVARANKSYEEGMEFFRRYRQGTQGENNVVLRKAAELLREAVDLYGQALEVDKDNKAVADRQLEASMIMYACLKNQTM